MSVENASFQASSALTEYKEVKIQSESQQSTDGNNNDNLVILDSLPYIDNVHPDYEAYALSLIEEEMQAFNPRPDAIHHLPNPLGPQGSKDEMPSSFQRTSNTNKEGTSLNRTEYAQLVQRNGRPRPDPIDYSETNIVRTPDENEQDTSSWERTLRHAKIRHEHQRIRLLNAELQSEYSTSLWKHQTHTLEDRYSKPIELELQEQRMEVDRLNARRKEMQEVHAGPKLQRLEMRWSELVGKNQRLVGAMGLLEEEVMKLREEIKDGSGNDGDTGETD